MRKNNCNSLLLARWGRAANIRWRKNKRFAPAPLLAQPNAAGEICNREEKH